MQFYVYSRYMIEAIMPHDDAGHLIISITTPGDPKEARLPTCDLTRGVYRVSFHDIDACPQEVEDTILAEEPELRHLLFSEAMAKDLLDWVAEKVKHDAPPVERILVHCDAGLSRSPGVAAGLAKTIFGQDDSEFFTRYHPNRRVYGNLLIAYANAQ